MLLKTRRARRRSDGPRRPHWTRGHRNQRARALLQSVSAIAASVLRVGGLAHRGHAAAEPSAEQQRAHNRAQWDLYPCTRVYGAAFDSELAAGQPPSD